MYGTLFENVFIPLIVYLMNSVHRLFMLKYMINIITGMSTPSSLDVIVFNSFFMSVLSFAYIIL